MKKRKEKKKTHNRFSNLTSIISWSIAVALLGLALVAAGYYFGYERGYSVASKSHQKEQSQTRALIKELEKQNHINEKEKLARHEKLERLLKREQKNYNKTAAHEYKDPKLNVVKPFKNELRVVVKGKPKLAIIIDDVSFSRDVKAIKSLHYPLTMSFLPPSAIHPSSAKLAAKEPYYMVHLPLEAQNFKAEETETLRVGDSQKRISRKISEIKRQFPKVEYINNHTGSKFTSNEIAMNRLIFALRQNGINFIDSRTTAQTQAPRVMKNYGLAYIARDVFLDHDDSIPAIKKQIKRAIKIAKKHGSCIAIGHPHKNTLEALRQSRKLLKEVQLVRIDHYL